MPVLAGAVVQESNTLSPCRSDLPFFESGCLLRGQDCLEGMAGARTEFGRFIAARAREGAELLFRLLHGRVRAALGTNR